MHADPDGRRDLVWRHGLGPEVIEPAQRRREIANFSTAWCGPARGAEIRPRGGSGRVRRLGRRAGDVERGRTQQDGSTVPRTARSSASGTSTATAITIRLASPISVDEPGLTRSVRVAAIGRKKAR